MKLTHFGTASRFAAIWDSDFHKSECRGASLATKMALGPHARNPGHTYAYLDGHAAFVRETTSLASFGYTPSFNTPVMTECYQVMWKGVTYYSSFSPRPSTNAELSGIISWPEM